MDISVHCIPHTVRRRLSEFLEPGGGIGLCGWELLMEELGYPPTTIGFTRNAPKSPDETITELVLRRFANEGGTVERLLEVFEQIRYLDAHTLLLESIPAIRKNHEAQSIDNHMEYSGGEFVKHPPCYDCRQLHDAMPSQWSSDTVQRPHAAQPQHPRSQNYVSCDDRGGDSMAAQASHISKMDTEETMMVTDGCDEYPVAMANVQLRDCKGIDDLMSTPLESRSPLLSGTSPCDRNNNDSELKFLLKSPPRDIKPDKSVLLSTQTEQQDRPYTQSPFGCSTAAETRQNVTTETIPKKKKVPTATLR